VAVEIPLFNRNQGNVAAARADIERAGQEKKTDCVDAARAGCVRGGPVRKCTVDGDGISGRDVAAREEAYGLMVDKYGRLLASYPRVLDVQRKLFELQIEYIAALESVWTNGIALQGYL